MTGFYIEAQHGQSKAGKTRRRRRRGGGKVILAVLLCLVLVGAVALSRHLSRQAEETEEGDKADFYVMDIPVYEDFLPEDAAARPGIKREIKYVVIHETDNFREGADAAAHNSFIHTNGQTTELSWHYTVDDHQIYHHLPDDEAAYHASDHMVEDGGNLNGIGVEMCVNADGDYEKTLQNAQKLTAYLLDAYDLTIYDVKKHQDFSGKLCPNRLIEEDRWEEFLEAVEQDLENLRREAAEERAQEDAAP